MKLSRIPVLGVIAVLATGICTGSGQTSVPVSQNAPRAVPNNGVRVSSGRPTNSNLPNLPRGPVNAGPRAFGMLPNQIQNQLPTNFRANRPRFVRQLTPNVAVTGLRQYPRAYNLQPSADALPRSEIERPTPPVTNPQSAVQTDDPRPTIGVPPAQGISEGLETADTQPVAKNDSVEPTARELTNGQVREHKGKFKDQAGKNRFSYSDALRRNWHEWHNRDWWKQHCNTIVFVAGGYYFLDSSYWYPAWGYDPANSYYDYNGPIYTYGNLLPDQVIANVQGALQDAGYYFGAITGSLSVETRAALVNYQRDQGLIVTGAIDEPTVESLGLY